MKTSNVTESTCPSCYRKLDLATDPEGKNIPKPNDLTVCIYCQEILIFQEDMSVKELSQEKIEKLPYEIQVKLMLFKKTAKKLINDVKFNNDNNDGLQDKP